MNHYTVLSEDNYRHKLEYPKNHNKATAKERRATNPHFKLNCLLRAFT